MSLLYRIKRPSLAKAASGPVSWLESLLPKPSPEPSPALKAWQQQEGARLSNQAWGNIGALSLAALATGAGLRGAKGLINRVTPAVPLPDTDTTVLPLPFPQEPEADEPEKRRQKALGRLGLGKHAADGPAAWFTEHIHQFKPVPGAEAVTGEQPTSPSGLVGYWPLMAAGGLLGVGAGWKGVDAALNQVDEHQRKRRLEEARSEFNEALMGQYDKPRPAPKLAGDGAAAAAALGPELDKLFAVFNAALTKVAAAPVVTKQAEERGWWSDFKANAPGAGANAYLTYAGLSSLLTGALVYDQMKKRSRETVLRKALAARAASRFQRQPTEIYARPEPVPHQPKAVAKDVASLAATPEDDAVASAVAA